MTWTQTLLAVLVFFGVLFGKVSRAYESVLDTGEILQSGHYDASVETEFIVNNGSGVNLVGRFDAPMNEDSQVRALIGGGTTDFQAGVFYKWVPIPDVRQQPAVGFILGGLYARDENNQNVTKDYLTVRVGPVISKAYQLDFGELTPYTSVPLGLRFGDGTTTPILLAVGAEVRPQQLKNIKFRSEIGFNINDVYSYISLNAVLSIDGDHGIEFK